MKRFPGYECDKHHRIKEVLCIVSASTEVGGYSYSFVTKSGTEVFSILSRILEATEGDELYWLFERFNEMTGSKIEAYDWRWKTHTGVIRSLAKLLGLKVIKTIYLHEFYGIMDEGHQHDDYR